MHSYYFRTCVLRSETSASLVVECDQSLLQLGSAIDDGGGAWARDNLPLGQPTCPLLPTLSAPFSYSVPTESLSCLSTSTWTRKVQVGRRPKSLPFLFHLVLQYFRIVSQYGVLPYSVPIRTVGRWGTGGLGGQMVPAEWRPYRT